MFAFASPRFWALFFTKFECHNCGSSEGYASRPRNFVERYAIRPLFLRPARCGDCYRRTWRPINVPLHPRQEAIRFNAEEMVASARAADQGETRKELRSSCGGPRRIA